MNVRDVTRGVVDARLGGRTMRLRCTLGALAEMEARLDLDSLEALGARLARGSAADLLVALEALARGAGEEPTGLADAAIAPKAAAEAVADAFRAAGLGAAEPPGKSGPPVADG